MEKSEECVICNLPIGTLPKAVLGEKGSISINKASKKGVIPFIAYQESRYIRNAVESTINQMK